MTDDLISRQAAIDAIERNAYRHTYLDQIISIIEQMPTADFNDYTERLWKEAYERGKKEAEPRKGKWIRPIGSPRCSYRYKCSECGEIAYQVTGNCGRKKKVPEPCCSYRFCPNCGSRMEE